MIALLVALAAAPTTARLEYQRGPGASDCPDEQALRGALAVRLGYDPFDPGALRTVRAEVAREGGGFVGRVTLADAAGAPLGEREVRSQHADCAELAEAMVLAISLAIDPLGTGGKPQAPPPPPPPAPPPQEPPPPSPPPRWDVSVGVDAAYGLAPPVSAAGAAQVRVRWPLVSVALEARVSVPISSPLTEGRMIASTAGATVLPCLHRGQFAGCLALGGGALWLSTDGVEGGERVTGRYLFAGARAALEIPLLEWLSVRGHVDLDVPLVRTTVTLDQQVVWSSPVLMFGGGLAAVFSFGSPGR